MSLARRKLDILLRVFELSAESESEGAVTYLAACTRKRVDMVRSWIDWPCPLLQHLRAQPHRSGELVLCDHDRHLIQRNTRVDNDRVHRQRRAAKYLGTEGHDRDCATRVHKKEPGARIVAMVVAQNGDALKHADVG
jgi:hypothetical protein